MGAQAASGGAPHSPPVRDVPPGGGRDVLPGQPLEYPAQGLLISQRREHVVTALLGDPLGGIGLGVHRIGAHHHPVQVEGLEQLPERGDLIGLVRHTCLGKDSARGLVQGRQEMRWRILACAGCAHGLAVHRNDCSSFDGAGTPTEPRPHMSVEVRGVQVLEHPPDGRLRRKSLSALKAQDWTAGCFSDSACFVFQAAFVKSRKSRSTSFGVRYPRAE